MNMSKIIIIILLIGSFSISCSAQLNVDPERATAAYEVGEMINFVINGGQAGEASYVIKYDDKSAYIDEGKIDLIANTDISIPFEACEAGIYIMEVTQGAAVAQTAIAVSPFDIVPLESEPSDFDTYWTGAIAEIRAIPMDPQVTLDTITADGTTYKINLANINNRRIYGYITIPFGAGPFSAALTLPPAGTSPNLAEAEPFFTENGNMISMSISIHNVDPDLEDPNAYEPNDISNRDTYYYKHSVLAIIRSIDYIFSRNDFDGQNLILTGNSQGGGLAIIGAGLDNRVKAISIANPALCQHIGLKYEKASGFPYYANSSRALTGDFSIDENAVNEAKYYDAIYFAQRYKGPCYLVVSYDDNVCPSATVFAAYNQIRGPKIAVQSQDWGHNAPNEYWSGRMDFHRRHVNNILTQSWQSIGYNIDAGNNKTTTANTPLTLNGAKDFDNELLNTEVYWEKLEGPGKVSFQNPNSLTTNVIFDQPGTYTLRLYTHDDQYISSLKRRITVEDVVKVTVN